MALKRRVYDQLGLGRIARVVLDAPSRPELILFRLNRKDFGRLHWNIQMFV